MTTVWERFKFAVAADMDALLTRKEEKNPLALLNRYVKEAEKQTEETGKLLERQAELNKKLESELAAASGMIEKRRHQLELAASAREEDLVRFAEQEIASYENRVAVLTASLAENKDEVSQLEQKHEEMKHKVKDMKIRQLQLMGKENATRAHLHMDRILNPERTNEPLASYDDMRSYIERLGSSVEEKHEQTVLASRLEALEKNRAQSDEIV